VFQNQELQNHLEESSVIKTRSAVIAEWNLNSSDNILQVGNYRYRPTESESLYNSLPSSFDINDAGNFYTNATYSDVLIDGGLESETETPITFLSRKEKENILYSLEDCFNRNRPRSGINKLRYFEGKFTHHTNLDMASRPRYYMPHKDDTFKYWTSYRQEDGEERGIANTLLNDQHFIDDAAPYVVYKDPILANRIVLKMQTNVGTVDLGPFASNVGPKQDPLFGTSNKTTPVTWSVQTLKNNNWSSIASFNSSSTRSDGTAIVKEDGYLELFYGLIIPERYQSFYFQDTVSSVAMLPNSNTQGYAYLLTSSASDKGTFYVWHNEQYETFVPSYGWQVLEDQTSDQIVYVTELVNPQPFLDGSTGQSVYREIDEIEGIRLAVRTMNKVDATFDLIEMSPRISADLSGRTTAFSVTKPASDLGISGLPVGQLLASTGSLSIFDYDQAFNKNNSESIISKYITQNLKVSFYEAIISSNEEEYYVPIKTMYAEGLPEYNNRDRSVEIQLRDLFYYFESLTAPQILAQNASVSYATSLLLDSIGFSNYVFKRLPEEDEDIIPYFFIPPDTTVAEILSQIAVSTQTAMFFDEYNNFVMMSKNYIMPAEGSRPVDMVLKGSKDSEDTGVVKNSGTKTKLSNIIDVSSQDNKLYNDGRINYTSRYLQRSVGTIKQASLIDRERLWIYKPVLLWEVAPTERVRSVNNEVSNQSSYVLGAIALNSNLSKEVPVVVNNQVINNVIDLGEGVYWVTRYSGYFHANGEVIRYDAVEYNVSGTGNVWINSIQEYQNYFSKLPFNGKIYPTGLVRIYSEPNFETISGVTQLRNGPVAKHGRGQFGTEIVDHFAGLSPYWYDNDNVRGCDMQSEYLFNLSGLDVNTLNLETTGSAGVSNELAKKTTRNSIIKNFLSTSYKSENSINDLYSTQTGTVQSSALIMNGPSFSTTDSPVDFISYVYKPLNNKFRHFGTRMRIVGKIENNEVRGQTGIGSIPYYVSETTNPSQNNNIGGSSGGLAFMVNPNTNIGYYFEIAALTANSVDDYASSENIHNVVFYKTNRNGDSGQAVPIKLFGGMANIIVDDGRFVGQNRMAAEESPTVYDLAVEYEDIGTTRRFYLYINNKIVATVDDESPLPVFNNMGLFVRGSSRIMFENIYALTNNYSQNTVFGLDTPVSSIFDDDEVDVNESFRKYAMSGIIQSTYLSGIDPSQPPKYNIYFEEFGTIMREADYFNIRYDKAYPALYAQLSPTFNKIKGYTVSGFTASSYGAEFLIFNSTDTAINLDETSGNYLRIQGVTFTQQATNELTVDNYYESVGDLSNPEIRGDSLVVSPLKVREDYKQIKFNRTINGRKEFVLDAPYIQSQDDARDLMSWVISKVSVPRKSVGIEIFSNPMLQLGDVVSVDYQSDPGIDDILSAQSRFVVYNIEYTRDASGPSMTIYLSEVV